MYMNDMANLILILSCMGLFVITCPFLLATGKRGCVL